MGKTLAFLVLVALISCASGLYRDGYERVDTGPGGFFGAVLDDQAGIAWFGVDDTPARIIKVDLTTMSVVGKLELEKDEERLWSFVKHGKYGYVGVESPGGRLVGVDLDSMTRLGYATASQFPLLAGTVYADHAYFSAGSNPATVMRLDVLKMQAGGCADWNQCRYEVSLQAGEEAVRSMFVDEAGKHLILAMYTEPGVIVKLTVPGLKRIGSLTLDQGEDKVLCGARYGHYGLFGTATSPGRLIKVDLRTMRRASSLEFVSGEDRPATIVMRGNYAFIGFGSAWAEGASSVVKVDVERMVRVSGVVTKEGQTWLYTGLGWQQWAFFGTRGTEQTEHATIVRVNMNPTFPGIPVPPVFNSSTSDSITMNWLREYPEYHNGGAPIIGARVLMRPADNHDWTCEHIYAYAAPDPAAPKDRISRVHENPAELLMHGYAATVDRLDEEKGYKFAVILTNEVGPSHRSRSSLAMATTVSWSYEGLFLLLFAALTGGLAWLWGASWANAPRIDALYTDNDREEEQTGSLLTGKKARPDASPAPPSGAGGFTPGEAEDYEGGVGARRLASRAASIFVSWVGQPGGMKRVLVTAALFSTVACVAAGVEAFFCAFVSGAVPTLDPAMRLVLCGVVVASVGACAWCCSAGYSSWELREYDAARRFAVGGMLALWASEVSSLMVLMSYTGSQMAPWMWHVSATLTGAGLAAGLLGLVWEAAVASLRKRTVVETVGLPDAFGISGGVSWLTE
eukprot:CAMPEP_0172066736 /NCGR_PEP_ID=MMETSP1043-20130122/11313_1 /TAXON_ID=464988 /ORGANISM="Hemiselmis andersenii, Strain CCMP441" /LENGTH=739 /DNA_ID=CAMNT_0012726901 /DNA_START=122 /DNA_END=2338 /DNA_ORIENTATION=+